MRDIINIKWYLLLILFFCVQKNEAQFTDNFNDGDLTNNPTWVGGTSDFTVNPSLQLQSNNLIASSSYYLSTANTLAISAQWEFYCQIQFNPSSANYIDVFLTASASDLSLSNTSGYFVRIGNTDDEISLYRKDANGTITKIIDGLNGILNTSSNVMKIKVIRNSANQWSLSRDLTGTGNSYINEGTVTDATFTTSSYFGIFIKQSTASFFQKHFFDDIEVKPYATDVTAPEIVSTNPISPTTLQVLFNEPVDLTSSQNITNYTVNNSIGNPISAVRDVINTSLVTLTFANSFANGVDHMITINAVQDLAGNSINNKTSTFNYYIPQRFDLVIDEIMADPTPVVSLPNAEFIEIKNTSGKSINLLGWKFTTSTSSTSLFPSYVLPADSFLVITSTSNAALFSNYGRVLGVSGFPSIDNTSSTLSLISKEGLTVHTVTYNISWYQNVVKSDGGWTLEMIDSKNPCAGMNNWKASVDLRGGTPAAKNSVDGVLLDNTAPTLLRASAQTSQTILVSFDEPLDSSAATNVLNYSISNGIGTPTSAICLSPAFNKVQLQFSNNLVVNTIYTLTVNGVKDCKGNTVSNKTTRLGLASSLDSFSVVINEILFNPKSGGFDFVELYNRSNKIVDLKDLYIANRSSSTDAITNLKQLTTDNTAFFPGDFIVITENASQIRSAFLTKNPDNFLELSTLPSYPDDKGVCLIINSLGTIVDQVRYDKKWHHALIDNEEGITLERIDYNNPTQHAENWHSAASTVGYGTPTYQNSQYRADVIVQGDISVTPKTFSPDNDGQDDFCFINYNMKEAGNIANITIFDAAGRPIKVVAKNAILGLKGSFRWDGLNDKNSKVPIGVYVVYTEIFNTNGKRQQFKNSLVVAARF